VITEMREPPARREAGGAILSHRDLAAQLYKERRDRDHELPEAGAFLNEPAWDMLLDLFIASEEGRAVNVTSACIGACVPSTTGLRWVSQLLRVEMISRGTDPFDGRKGTLSLTRKTVAGMRRYLDRVGLARGYSMPATAGPD
jgi:hypothetical protein